MNIKLIWLTISLMVPIVTFGGSDIMEKQLLQYKYVLFFQQISPFKKKNGDYIERKVYYIENKTEIPQAVNWLKEYYPDRNPLDTHMLAILPYGCVMFTNKLPTSYADMLKDDENVFFNTYLNFDIDGKLYFTKEQLTQLYKLFEDKGIPLKFDDTPNTQTQ